MYGLAERLLRVPGSAPAEAGVVLCTYLLAVTLLPAGPISPLAITVLTAFVWAVARRLPAALGGPGAAWGLVGVGAMLLALGALALWLDGTRWLMHLYTAALLIPVVQALGPLRDPAREDLPPAVVRQVARVHIITACLLILVNAMLAEAGAALHWVIFRALAPVAFFLLRDLMADLTVPLDGK